jgi:very-short-patch-repair endonuclease
MELHLRAFRLDEGMFREYRFAKDRRWRFDFCWPDSMLALEVEGGIWTGGRHTRGSGYIADIEKYNRATSEGWRVFRVTGSHIKSGEAVAWVREALRAKEPA